MTNHYPLQGGCTCKQIRYELKMPPLFVNCCHCHWCQRETGSAFVINAMLEEDYVALLTGSPELIETPSESGKGQKIYRCPNCRIAVWSHYAGAGTHVYFIRVGTLDNPDNLPPDIHIFTESKQAWVILPEDVPQVLQYYDYKQYWPVESQNRLQAFYAKLKKKIS